MRNCLVCGVDISDKRSDAVYCSKAHKLQGIRKGISDTTLTPVTKTPRPHPLEEYDYEYNLKKFQAMGVEPVEWLATNTGLDELTKLPIGRIIELYGPEGVGKTTLALNLIQSIKDKRILYIDTESTLDPNRLTKLKMPADLVTIKKLGYVEEIYDTVLNEYENYDLIVVDSIANCSFQTEFEGSAGDANIGIKARVLNKLMRLMPHKLSKSRTTLLLINQERQSIGGYVTQFYTPGGAGIQYACSLRIRLKTTLSDRFPKDPKDGIYQGHLVEAEIKKSKVSVPFRKHKFKLYYV